MRRARIAVACAGVAAPLAALVLWARYIEPAWLDVTFTELAWRGPPLRLALLTDIHAAPSGARRTARVVRRTNALAPDVVLLGGDFVDGVDAHPSKLEALAPLSGLRARLGVFGVLGNHDSGHAGARAIARTVTRAGVRLLDNEHVILPGAVALVGLGSFRAHASAPDRAFAGLDERTPTLVLVHNHKSLGLPGVRRFDLALAGHTHGGQGCVPFTEVCPFLEEDMLPYTRGLYSLPRGGRLYVSRGIGTSGVPARIGARPEIAHITLSPRP